MLSWLSDTLDSAGLDELSGLGAEAWGEIGRGAINAGWEIVKDQSPGGEYLPDVFREAARPYIGDIVDRVRVHWGSILVDKWAGDRLGLTAAIHADTNGQTYGHDIYVKAQKPDLVYDEEMTRLLLHEMVHSTQYERYSQSLSNFGYHYFKKYAQAGFSYQGNEMEEEAYGFDEAYTDDVFNNLWAIQISTSVSGVNSSHVLQFDGDNQVLTWDAVGRTEFVHLYIEQRPDVTKNEWRTVRDEDVPASDAYDFNVDGVGSFIFTVTAGNVVLEMPEISKVTATVMDDDRSEPYIDLNGPRRYITDASSRVFGWSVTDNSGLQNVGVEVWNNGKQTTSSDWENGGAPAAGSFDFTSYGPGFFSIHVESWDSDLDWPARPRTDDKFEILQKGDSLSSEDWRFVTVTDDDVTPPQISFTTDNGLPLVGVGYQESHGLTNTVGWRIMDSESGVGSVNVNVFRDETLVQSFQAAADDVANLDALGVGTFRVEVHATNADADGWAGDAETRIASATLTVTNDPPQVFHGGPYLLLEGQLLELHASATDPDPGDEVTLLYEWDLDGDGEYDDANGRTPVITWDELTGLGVADDGTYWVSVQVTDSLGLSATSRTALTVINGVPNVEWFRADPVIDENDVLTVVGAYSDAGLLDTHDVLISWGDGSTSPASVDQATRTFEATHLYSDDQPTATAFDEYVITVQVTDDDGGQNPTRTQVVTVETNSTGAIELPAFQDSLPSGVSGLLESAHVMVDPLPTSTMEAAGQSFNHNHIINYPKSGPFNLPAVSTNTASAVGTHRHSFNQSSQTKTFTGTTSYNEYFKDGKTYSLTPRSTTSGSSALPSEYPHEHSSGDVKFTTTTTFTYTPRPKTIVNTTFSSLPSNIDLNGDASRPGSWVRLTGGLSQMGSLLVDKTNEAINAFEATFDLFIGGGTHADGFSFGYGPIPNGAVFGEDGYSNRPGLWVTFDTYDNGGSDLVGIEVWYNGVRRLARSAEPTQLATGHYEDVEISITASGTLTVIHPFWGFASTIGGWSPSSSWRFGMGARTGGSWDYHSVDNLKIVDNTVRSYTTTVTRSATNQYILPEFNTSLGTFTKAVVKLDAGTEYTSYTDGGQFLHEHETALQVYPFDFGEATTAEASAGVTHAHLVDFQPAELDFVSAEDLENLFQQDHNVLLPQTLHSSTTTLDHNHDIAAETVPFRTLTTFTYDVASTVVRVNNVNPEITAFSAPTEILEDGMATISLDFTDQGPEDTHRAVVDWGNGAVQELAMPAGTYSLEVSHRYADDTPSVTPLDTYAVRVTVVDDDGGSASVTHDLTVSNINPVLSLAGSSPVAEGTLFQLPQATFTDIGRADDHTATIDWNDGTVTAGLITEANGAGVIQAEHVFADDGEYFVEVALRDDDEGVDTKTIQITVENCPPTIDSLGGNLSGSEGTALTFQAEASDPGNDTLTYTWDFGDNSPEQSGVDLQQIEHTYADDGTYTVRLTVEDDDGGSTAETMTVVVADVAAQVLLVGTREIDEGTACLLSIGEVVDPGNDPVAGFVVDWGDGAVDRYGTPGIKSHTYADGPNDWTVAVSLDDGLGGEALVGELNVAVRNVAPTLSEVVGVTNGSEGGTFSFAASAADPGDDSLTYTWDFGDQSSPVVAQDLTDVTHEYADDGVYFVSVTVEDDEGATNTRSLPVVVSNVRPTILLDGLSDIDEGDFYTLTLGSVSDPGEDTVEEWIVDWGDGLTDSYQAGGAVSHVYMDGPATCTIHVGLRDEDGLHVDAGQLDVTVHNVAPTILGIQGDTGPEEIEPLVSSLSMMSDFGPVLQSSSLLTVQASAPSFEVSGNEGFQVNFTAEVHDPGGLSDLLTFTWDFADGSPAVTGLNLHSVSHTFADNGDFAATLTVSDDEGATAEAGFTVLVHNVAPVIVLSGQDQIGEGQEYALDFGPITDPGNDKVTQWIVDWGDGSQNTYSEPTTARHTYADGPAQRQIQVELVDDDGNHPAAGVLDVAINNISPTITQFEGVFEGAEGAPLEFTAMATDAGAASDPLNYIWDFGDGASVSGYGLTTVEHAFGDDGDYLVTLTVDDNDGGQDQASLPVIVSNVEPTIELLGSSSAVEGEAYQLTLGTITDPGTETVTEWRVDWGDGASQSYDSAAVIDHVYADGLNSFTVLVTLVDEDGTHVSAGLHEVEVVNASPVIEEIVGDPDPQEGDPLFFSALAFDPSGEFDQLTYTWDFGDGSNPVTGESLSAVSHAYADDGVYHIVLTVADDDGASVTSTVEYAVANVAPTCTFDYLAVTREGQTYVLTPGGIYDPGQDAIGMWIVDWGDGHEEIFQAGDALSHVYADGPIQPLVGVSVTDEDGTYFIEEFAVEVLNAPPDIASLQSDLAETDEGSPFVFSGAASDPAGTADTLTYTWLFNDDTEVSGDVDLTSVTHTYADDGEYVVVMLVSDEDDGGMLDTISVTVNNVAPEFEAGPDTKLEPPSGGLLSRLEIPFTDPGADWWSGTVNYGDGTGDQPLTVHQASKTLDLQHTYTDNGTYTVSVTLDDDDGGTCTDFFSVEVSLAEIEFAAATFEDSEDNGLSNAVTLVRTPAEANVTSQVLVSITGGTAIAGTDYDINSFPLLLTFEPGVDTVSVPVPVIPDNLVELNETITFVVTAANNALIVEQDNATLTVQNDDTAEFTVSSVSGSEDDGPLTFTVMLSNPVDVATSIVVSTVDGTALVSDSDYEAVDENLTLWFDAEEISQTFAVDLISDIKVEPHETFAVNLNDVNSQGRAVFLSGIPGWGTIENDDFLAGRVFDDLDNDGVFEEPDGDAGIEGVLMQLVNEDTGATVDEALTDADGRYRFDEPLEAGTYRIVEITDRLTEPGLLDGYETAGVNGGTINNSQDCDEITGIDVTGNGTADQDAVDYLFAEIRPADIYGIVWRDFNDDGEINFGEVGIENALMSLTGTDDRGNAVSQNVTTAADGSYVFPNLRPGSYSIEGVQPSGFDDGRESLGEVTDLGLAAAVAEPGSIDGNDKFSGLQLVPGAVADHYNFGERPQAGDPIGDGATAGIGFWHNKNGQALIQSLNGGPEATQLGDWLAATFPAMYGDGAFYDAAKGADQDMNLAGKTNAEVAEVFMYLFQRKGKDAVVTGTPKVDAQVMAVALATYVTSETLAGGAYAADYGLNTSADGIAYNTFNVLDVLTEEEADSLGLAPLMDSDGHVAIIDLLLATDRITTSGLLCDADGDASISDLELWLRKLVNNLFAEINEGCHC